MNAVVPSEAVFRAGQQLFLNRREFLQSDI
jgi:hypothetical protein